MVYHMTKRLAVVTAAAIGLCWLAAETANAQVRFGVRVGSPRAGVYVGNAPYWYGGGPYYRGYYGPGYGRYWDGRYWDRGYYGSGPYYGSYRGGYYYDYPYYTYSYPRRYVVYDTPSYYYGPGYTYSPRSENDFYSSYNNNGERGEPVYVQVRVPTPDAEIWFGDSKTSKTGTVREFVSPAVEPGRTYTYEIRARWMEDGQRIERTRTVSVHAGERIFVDFTQPQKGE